LTALGLARTLAPDTPFILVSGTMGEDAAVDSLRSGATDYVLKMRLSRLAPAVRRAVEESRERRGRRTMAQELERERNFLRTLLDSLGSGVLACDQSGAIPLMTRRGRQLYDLPIDGDLAPDWRQRVRLMDTEGNRLDADAFPLPRALRGETLRH